MTRTLSPTQNDLPLEVRRRAVDMLNQHLADAIVLRLQAKQAHWNVTGTNFIALHGLFDHMDDAIAALVDDLAERVVQLGGVAFGTAAIVVERSRLPEYPSEIRSGGEHVQALSLALATYGRLTRAAIDAASSLPDVVSADLMTQTSRVIDKLLWKVEAHAECRVARGGTFDGSRGDERSARTHPLSCGDAQS